MLTQFTVLGTDVKTGEVYTGTLTTYDDVKEGDKRECKVFKDEQPITLTLHIEEILIENTLG